MAQYPGAIQKPITASKGRKKLSVWNRVNAHVAVSEASSLFGAFNRSGQVDCHLYIRRGTAEQIRLGQPATVEQYVDTDWQAFADLDGNDATISVETQGGVNDPNGEMWDPAQREALAQIFAWAVRTHNIQEKMATSSKIGDESKGLSWHRLGVDGNFPNLPNIHAGRIQRGGGMHYSKARGKICPGDAKISQIPGVFARAQDILHPRGDGGTVVTPPTKPVVKPTPVLPPEIKEFTDMNPFVIVAPDSTWFLVTPGAGKPTATQIGRDTQQDKSSGFQNIETVLRIKEAGTWNRLQGAFNWVKA